MSVNTLTPTEGLNTNLAVSLYRTRTLPLTSPLVLVLRCVVLCLHSFFGFDVLCLGCFEVMGLTEWRNQVVAKGVSPRLANMDASHTMLCVLALPKKMMNTNRWSQFLMHVLHIEICSSKHIFLCTKYI